MKTLSFMLCTLLFPAALFAAQTVHLTLSSNGERIEGDSTQTSLGRENTIECLSFTHEVFQPRDAASGLPTGKRQHGPITVTKRIDKSSPLLARSLTNNEVIEGVFRFYRPNPAGDGTIQHFYTMHVLGALNGLRTLSPDTLSPETTNRPAMEEVSFVFHTITWTYEPTGATHSDSTIPK